MARSMRRNRAESQGFVTAEVRAILDTLDTASVVLTPGESIMYYSPSAVALGVVRDDKLASDDLLALVRTVRRTGQGQSGSIDVPLGPIGEGTRKVSVRVKHLPDHEVTIAFFADESEAERIDAVRRDFVANISHELKTPISALRTLSDAVTAAAEDPQVVKFATMMHNEVERLSNLVQEIINLSRLQDSDPLLDALTVDIDEAVDQAIGQSQFLADSRDIEVIRGPRAECSVVGDRKSLIMAFHNLIENAINYSPDKTRVTVNTTAAGGIVEITVIDQGVGIPESELNRIFERFYRVDPARSRETGGTGLGLSIVKHVVANHGGEVIVWSSQGVGSTFSIRLPIGEEVITKEEMA
jgi:two-component system sensor histidine kinase SenX3